MFKIKAPLMIPEPAAVPPTGGTPAPAEPAPAPAAVEPAPAPAAVAPVEPAPAPAPVPDGVTWLDGLSADLRENPTLKDTPSIEALAKRFIDTKAMVGNSLRIPGEHATPDDIAAFRQTLLEKNLGLMPTPDPTNPESMEQVYKAIGLPETPSEYVRPENWQGVDDERFGFLSKVAHEAGLSKHQFEKMANNIAAADNQILGGMEQQRQADLGQLRGEWGNAYDQKTQRAVHIAKQLGAPERLMSALNDNQVDAATYRWLDNLASKFGKEGAGLINDDGMSTLSEFTPTEINAQMAEITRQMLTLDTLDPNYKVLMQKRIELAAKLNPE